MKRFFLNIVIAITLVLPTIAFAQEQLSKEMVTLANEVIMDIYYDILDNKERYPELSQFDESSLGVNKYGIYVINYANTIDDPTLGQVPYAFGITIIPTGAAIFKAAQQYAFNLAFPLIGVKFAGYQIITFKSKQFDIQPSLGKFGNKIWNYQQKFMPIQITLKSSKPAFKTGEDIDFTVTLTNSSNQNLRVKELSSNTLYFVYDNKVWGAYALDGNPSAEKEVILNAKKSLTKVFRGKGFSTPKEFDIHCTYSLTFKGVKPSNSLQIKVVE